ncbi:MAG: hypothetical protein JWQ70_2131 [Aeromicrobium sp.]|nr:hypothetical protein [Aeromicrobium sp.]
MTPSKGSNLVMGTREGFREWFERVGVLVKA